MNDTTKKTIYRRLTSGFLLVLILSIVFTGCGDDSPTSPRRFDKIVYVAMGASDAVGIGAFPLDKGYVYRIHDDLQKRIEEVKLFNLGVSGKRIAYLESAELPVAIARQPHLVTIWAGPNDIIHGTTPEDFEQDLSTILVQLRSRTAALIVIANVPDLTILPRFLIAPDSDVTLSRVLAYNDAIMRQAAFYKVPIVDLYSGGYAAEWEYVSVDGFHPSNKGYAKIAQLFLDIILPHF